MVAVVPPHWTWHLVAMSTIGTWMAGGSVNTSGFCLGCGFFFHSVNIKRARQQTSNMLVSKYFVLRPLLQGLGEHDVILYVYVKAERKSTVLVCCGRHCVACVERRERRVLGA